MRLLSQMMEHQLDDVHRRGEPVAVLWASEAPIYGRFGYGPAVPHLTLTGSTRATAFRPGTDLGDGWLSEPAPEEYRAAVVDLHARLLPQRPGGLDRAPGWWDQRLFDQAEDRDGASALRYVLHHAADGAADGYALYRVRGEWAPEGPAGEVIVLEVDAATGPGLAALWRFLLDLDLVRRFSASETPIDGPLRYLVADSRAVRASVGESLYVRVVDVKSALASRAYAADLDVVIGVRDGLFAHNDGAFRVQATTGGPAKVTRARRRPDLSLDVRELGAVYLAGTSVQTLAGAGLVTERTPGSVAAASRAFDWQRKPFCPDHF